MKSVLVAHLLLATICSGPPAWAQSERASRSDEQPPIGRWVTVNEVTGKANSVVRIFLKDGALCGTIEKLIDPDPGDASPRCTLCAGEMKNRPLVGLQILWGLRRANGQWLGGKILDPENGKTYRCQIAVADDGNKLKVRGYIGLSWIGRTEEWTRER